MTDHLSTSTQYPPIRIGGMLRCCIQTLRLIGPPTSELTEGDTMACSYCSDSVTFHDGAWERNGKATEEE